MKRKDSKKKSKSQSQVFPERKMERIKSEQIKKVKKQFQVACSRIADIKAALTEFENYLEETKNWAVSGADHEQLKQCEKALPDCNINIYRLMTRANEKFTKVKVLFPSYKTDEKQYRKIQRKSSVVADKLWVELRGELGTPEEKTSSPPVSSTTESISQQRPLPVKRSFSFPSIDENAIPEEKSPPITRFPDYGNIPEIKFKESPIKFKEPLKLKDLPIKYKEPPQIETPKLVSVGKLPSLEQLLAEESEEDITRLLDEMDPELLPQLDNDESSDHDDFHATESPNLEFSSEYSTGISEDDPESRILEAMDDMTFEELLQGLVMSPKDRNVSAAELLQRKLAALKSQYADIIGSDFDIFGGDI